VLGPPPVDHQAAENDAPIVQKYWSVSVEGQLYILWPVLIVLLLATRVALTRQDHRVSMRRAVGAGLGIVVLASWVYSVVLTILEPGVGYFSTATRAWEFGAGGLLALAGNRPPCPSTVSVVSACGGEGLPSSGCHRPSLSGRPRS